MKKRTIFTISLLSFFLIAGIGACRNGNYRGGFDEFDLEAATNRIASRLELTDSQKAELEDIISEIAAKAKELRTDRDTRQEDVANLVRQEAISKETVDLMISEKLDKMKELADLASSRLITFHASLSPEQRDLVARHIEDHSASKRCFFRR
jgi:uncharacterized membrane protein